MRSSVPGALLETQAPPLARVERVTSAAIGARRGGRVRDRRRAIAAAARRGAGLARHARPAPTACASCPTRPTAGSATRSSTAPTAARGSPSSRDVPYDRPLTTMARLRHVRGVRGGVRRSGGPPVPRPADLLPGVRPAAAADRPHAAAGARAGDPLAGARPRLLRRRARRWRSRGSAATTWPWTRAASRPPSALRARKHREDKPFAVMVGRPGGGAASSARWTRPAAGPAGQRAGGRSCCCPRRPGAPRSPPRSRRATGSSASCCPTRRCITCCSREVGRPIVLTSGNVSDEPIAYRDDDALERLAGIADAFLTHDRPIHIRTDDSVVRAVPRPGDAAPPLARLRARAARPRRPPAPGRCSPAARS